MWHGGRQIKAERYYHKGLGKNYQAPAHYPGHSPSGSTRRAINQRDVARDVLQRALHGDKRRSGEKAGAAFMVICRVAVYHGQHPTGKGDIDTLGMVVKVG